MHSPGDRPRTILVVAKEPAILRLLHLVLTGRGFVVYLAASPERAVELCREHLPTIALADLKPAGDQGSQLSGCATPYSPRHPLLRDGRRA
jgi:CheY-like chemotaxis protein